MDLTKVIYDALDGNAVLFLGSGFSMGATKANNDTFGVAFNIAHKLCKYCGYSNDLIDDLGEASSLFREEKSDAELLDFLRQEFTACDVTSAQQTIAEVPWQRVYTTNYDNVFELASKKCRKERVSVVLSENKTDFKNKSKLCIHLNGDVSKLSVGKLDGEFRLTDKSYLVQQYASNPWLSLFRTDLDSAKAIIFIGYSLKYDIEIKSILNSISNQKLKTFFVVEKDISQLKKRQLERYGTVIPIETDGFASKIKEAKANYVKVDRIISYDNLRSFTRPVVSSTPPVPKDSDELDLILKGEIKPLSLLFSILSPDTYHYVVRRQQMAEVVDMIKNGKNRILIHSDLGNGKTVFMIGLSQLLARDNYQVFNYSKYSDDLAKETEAICKMDANPVIMVDDYYSHSELTKILKNFCNDNVTLIVSERSAINDFAYDNIRDAFGEFNHICLNTLAHRECIDFSDLLEYHGLWASMAAADQEKKIRFIKSKCHSEIKNVILKLLKSPNILNRFSHIINAIKNKAGFYEAILFMLISNILKLDITLEELALGVDLETINSPEFSRNVIVREFINFDQGSLKLRSSLASEVILQEIFDPETVLNVLVKIFHRVHNFTHERKRRKILKELMRFSNIQKILNTNAASYRQCIQDYYLNLKNLAYCRDNPLFWLQYSILKLSERDYPQANQYLRTAYALADARNDGYDTYQLDNQYARFILENEIENGTSATFMKAFREAHNILANREGINESRYYPYRVARLYLPFYNKFFKEMSEDELMEFLKGCQDMLDKINLFLENKYEIHSRKDVINAKNNIITILTEQHLYNDYMKFVK